MRSKYGISVRKIGSVPSDELFIVRFMVVISIA
jgi:hypothetical protein